MRIDGASALITGARGGVGPALVRALLDGGAATVYAGVREPGAPVETGAVAVTLDVTDRDRVRDLARLLPDVNVVVNNAGVAAPGTALTAALGDAQRAMDVNYLGIINVTQAFAPVLAGNGGGALVNVLSVLSWVAHPGLATYGASKAAAWSLTNALRMELRSQRTLVVGVHAGFIDADVAAAMTGDRLGPGDVADAVVLALEGEREEVLVDEYSRTVKAALHDDLGLLYGPSVDR